MLTAVSGSEISFGKLMIGFGDRIKTGMKNFAFALTMLRQIS